MAGVIVVTALAACGGDSSPRQEYVSKLNALCAKYADEHRRIGEPETLEGLRVQGPRILRAFERLLAAVRKLTPPGELAGETQHLLELGDQQRVVLRRLIEAARAGDLARVSQLVPRNRELNAEANEVTRRIGADDCAGG